MKPILILATAVLLVAVATNSHFVQSSADAENVSISATIPPINIPSNLGQSDEAGPEVKLVLLALLPHGFDTNQMQIEAGDYLFIVANRTGLREVNVRLERGGNERVASATVRGSRIRWKQRLKLTPGSYLVTADDNPDWTCRIVVRP